MTRSILLLIALSVTLSAFAQLTLKMGMASPAVQSALQIGYVWHGIAAIATSGLVIGGLALYFASAAVWLMVLAKVDVSIAYPFVAGAFVLTMLLAWVIRDEPLSLAKVGGTALIAAGVILLSRA